MQPYSFCLKWQAQTVTGMYSQNLRSITQGTGDFCQLLVFFCEICIRLSFDGSACPGFYQNAKKQSHVYKILIQDIHKFYLWNVLTSKQDIPEHCMWLYWMPAE